MEHLYKTQEELLEKTFTQDKSGEKVEGYLLYPAGMQGNISHVKICTPEDVKSEFKSHTITLFKRFKEILEVKKEVDLQDSTPSFINGWPNVVGTAALNKAAGINEGLSTAIAEVENFIKSLEK